MQTLMAELNAVQQSQTYPNSIDKKSKVQKAGSVQKQRFKRQTRRNTGRKDPERRHSKYDDKHTIQETRGGNLQNKTGSYSTKPNIVTLLCWDAFEPCSILWYFSGVYGNMHIYLIGSYNWPFQRPQIKLKISANDNRWPIIQGTLIKGLKTQPWRHQAIY